MKRVGVLVLIDVPEDATPEDVSKMMPRVIDTGLSEYVDADSRLRQDWVQRRLFVLSDAHTEAFTQCLTPEGSR